MPRLIKGESLSSRQRQQVLAAYVHRWTHENARQTYRGECPACVQRRQSGGSMTLTHPQTGEVVEWHNYHSPLVSDDQWLREHAFWFTNNGDRLSQRHHHAEPAYLAA